MPSTMPSQRYTSTAIALHWIVALLFLGSYTTVYFREWFTEDKTPANAIAFQLHLAIGISILAIVALRVVWRLTHTPPPLPPGPEWQQKSSRILHYILYAVMIIMPITGYLGAKSGVKYFGFPGVSETAVFQWLVVERMGLTFKDFEQPFDFVHKRGGAYVVWILIAGHAAAALYHHIALRDTVLKRMLPQRG